jgi:hypothetical protein
LDLVEGMCSPVYNTGRNVTMDNYFTSLEVVNKMLHSNKLTMVGTIRKNKREIPELFKNSQIRPVNSSILGFQENVTLLSYAREKPK